MLEALWSVSFLSNVTPVGGTGIVVFETGRILGGDSGMIYTGNYRVVNGVVEADVHVETYANVPGLVSNVGFLNFDLKVAGPLARDTFVLSGHVVQDPNRKIVISFIRRAELP
jgi:hypothetical protein